MIASGRPRPTDSRNEAMNRPGCTAGFGGETTSGPSRRARFVDVVDDQTKPQNDASSPPCPGRLDHLDDHLAEPVEALADRARPRAPASTARRSPASIAPQVRSSDDVITTTWSNPAMPERMVAETDGSTSVDVVRRRDRRSSATGVAGSRPAPTPTTPAASPTRTNRSATPPIRATPSSTRSPIRLPRLDGAATTSSATPSRRSPRVITSVLDAELPRQERQHVGAFVRSASSPACRRRDRRDRPAAAAPGARPGRRCRVLQQRRHLAGVQRIDAGVALGGGEQHRRVLRAVDARGGTASTRAASRTPRPRRGRRTRRSTAGRSGTAGSGSCRAAAPRTTPLGPGRVAA